MITKYIKVDKVQVHLALQEFARKIEEAVREGYTVSSSVKYHARELGFGQFDITLVKPATTGLVQVGTPTPQQTVLTTSAPEALFEGGAPGPSMHELSVENPFEEESFELPGDSASGVAPPAVTAATTNPVLAHLETLKNKQDLVDFATKYGIDIPEDVKIPTAIKKYLKVKVTNTA